LHRSTRQQTGSCKIAGTATASDQAVVMLCAHLHTMLCYTGTVRHLGEWMVYAHMSWC
jgi:hypothetical protein